MKKSLIRTVLVLCAMVLPLSFADAADARKAGKGQQDYLTIEP